MTSDGFTGKKKKVTIISVSAIVLVAMVVAVTVGVTNRNGAHTDNSTQPEITTSTKAIQSICQPTDYKETCEKSLTAAASNVTDPKELVKVAFQVAVKEIKRAMDNSTTLKELVKDPRSSKSIQNCKELMEYSVNDLENSFEKLGDFDISNVDDYLGELNVWLSASITFQTTCLDQFENRTDDAGEKMKAIMKTSMELTHNSLNMVSQLSSILETLNIPGLFNRRLLGDQETDTPDWMNDEHRRLLHATAKPNVIVAKDGSGKYKTINEALKAIPLNSKTRFVVYVKAGVYNEIVTITKDMTNVLFVGDGPTKTKVTGNMGFTDGIDIWKTATFTVNGDGFIAKGMGFENSAGASKRQAVALRVQSKRGIIYNCQIDGYQATLFAHAHQQFYRDCTISGTVDIIFGNAKAIFQNCKINVRLPLVDDGQTKCYVTADGREVAGMSTALVLQNCSISATAEYLKNMEAYGLQTYLGRPWKEYAKTIVMESHLDSIVSPLGWIPWTGNTHTENSFLSEFDNRGPGALAKKRAKWAGVKKTTKLQAVDYTVHKLIHGDRWIKAAGVPFTSGLITAQ